MRILQSSHCKHLIEDLIYGLKLMRDESALKRGMYLPEI